MFAPFFFLKVISLLTFIRVVLTGTLRMVMIIGLFVVEWALMLFLFLASLAPEPETIADVRRAVATIDPFEPLKHDSGPVGLLARMFL
jgi:hypothetical protein